MIRVTIELLPHGVEALSEHLGTIEIANDGTGTQTVGNYKARLSKRGNPNSVWRLAEVEGFPRKRLGADDLVLWVLLRSVIE